METSRADEQVIQPVETTKIYAERFSEQERRRKENVWRVLCRHFFQRYVGADDTVLDLGAGYCEFINNIQCRTRIAVDLNPETKSFAAQDVLVLSTPSTDMQGVPTGSVDVVFASNFFEHLPSKLAFFQTLNEIHRVLKNGGRLLILQPNIRVLGGRYWDFIDHHIPLSDKSIVEALHLINMQVIEVRPRFLPFTTKSRLPQHTIFVRVYLMFPLVQRLLGGQAWVVGEKP